MVTTSEKTVFDMTLEVLRENGADLYAALVRYRDAHAIPDDSRREVMVLEEQVFADTERLLTVKDQKELERIRGGFDFARACLKRLNGAEPK